MNHSQVHETHSLAEDDPDRFDDPARILEIVSKHQCMDLLPMVGIGRVAASVDGSPEIFPVNFARMGEDIVFMTGDGTKLAAAIRGGRLAFEVDYANPLYHTGWSVVVKGRAELIENERTLTRARRLPLAPWAPGNRMHYVRIVAEDVSGRRIVPTHDGNRHRSGDSLSTPPRPAGDRGSSG